MLREPRFQEDRLALANQHPDRAVRQRHAKLYGLGFLPVSPEHYDFLVVETRRERPAVQAFLSALHDERVRARVRALGMEVTDD